MKPSPRLAVVTSLVAALLAFGAISRSWFATPYDGLLLSEGVLGSEVCGFGVGDGIDELEEFGRYQATGVMPPPRPWTCERELTILRIVKVRNAFHFLAWVVALIAFLAGLALSALLLLALRGRRVGRPITVLAIIALTSAIVFAFEAILGGGYTPTDLSYGAIAYVVGVVGAFACARSLTASRPAPTRMG